MTQRERVLQMLQEAGPAGVTTGDFLAAHLPRFSARLLELRNEGHVIHMRRVREGSWRYQLISSPSRVTAGSVPPPPAGPAVTPAALFDLPPQPGNAIHGEAA